MHGSFIFIASTTCNHTAKFLEYVESHGHRGFNGIIEKKVKVNIQRWRKFGKSPRFTQLRLIKCGLCNQYILKDRLAKN
ncbi:hypothetical protein ACU8KH_00998 [Lachancea thermotolerans]